MTHLNQPAHLLHHEDPADSELVQDRTVGWVLLVAFCGTFSHYCMARAMHHAEATTLVPIDFLRVPLTALAGWALYAERVDLFTVAGMGLILAGVLVINLMSNSVAG